MRVNFVLSQIQNTRDQQNFFSKAGGYLEFHGRRELNAVFREVHSGGNNINEVQVSADIH